MRWTVSRCIGAGHPALPGHFPGDPIVPAVVLLNEVLDAVHERVPGVVLTAIPLAKFANPLRPNVAFEIRLEMDGKQVRFDCRAGDVLIAQGRIDVETSP